MVSVLTFLTGGSAKLKRSHVKCYTVVLSCAKRLGVLAVMSLTGASRSFHPALITRELTNVNKGCHCITKDW